MYDDKRESDSILFLRIFEEWVSKFRPEMNKAMICMDANGAVTTRSREGRRRDFRRASPAEMRWCNDRCLDFTILREVAFLSEEIQYRFLKMNIPVECLNSRVKLREDDPSSVLILKLCIGGAFYNKYVKAEYKNEDLL